MKHISIPVPKEAVMASIIDPSTLLHGVNDFLEQTGKTALFDIQLVGLSRRVKLTNGRFSVHTDALLKEIKKTDFNYYPSPGR